MREIGMELINTGVVCVCVCVCVCVVGERETGRSAFCGPRALGSDLRCHK